MKVFLVGLVGLLLCALPLAAQTPPQKEEGILRIVSWNVHNCIGTDGKRDFDRVAGIITRCDPDVAAVQELDSMTIRIRRHVLGELARRTGMHATYAPAIKFGRGRYGIGMLSKEKPVKVTRIPLPGKEEKRMLLVCEFERYVVLCTHFSLTAADRIASAKIILDAVGGIEKPLFLAGDMNDYHDSEMQRILTEKFTVLSDTALATFGTGDRAKCIDYIYGLDNGAPRTLSGRGVIPVQTASDHRPVWVDVKKNGRVSSR